MSRILLVSAPLPGHVLPLVPLGRELLAAGHEVLVATAADGATALRESGLEVRDLEPGLNFGALALRTMLTRPKLAAAELAGRADINGIVSLLFGAVGKRMLPGVAEVVESWHPDVVVHEPLAAAGPKAAADHGIPYVIWENALFPGPPLVTALADGLGWALPSAAEVVSTAPAGLAPLCTGRPARVVPYNGTGEAPPWLTEPAAGKRIVVSRSTVPGPGSGDLMRTVLKTGVDAEIVLVRPDKSALRWLRKHDAPNVRTVDRVPLDQALSRADAIVHHGGAGTVLAALDAGVPQLVVPGAGDRRHNAELIAARGVGLAVEERAITAAVLTQLVTDGKLRQAVADLVREQDSMPPLAEVAAEIAAVR